MSECTVLKCFCKLNCRSLIAPIQYNTKNIIEKYEIDRADMEYVGIYHHVIYMHVHSSSLVMKLINRWRKKLMLIIWPSNYADGCEKFSTWNQNMIEKVFRFYISYWIEGWNIIPKHKYVYERLFAYMYVFHILVVWTLTKTSHESSLLAVHFPPASAGLLWCVLVLVYWFQLCPGYQ